MKWIGCRVDDCIEGQKAIKREMDKQRSRQEYLMKVAVAQGVEPYVSPLRETEAGPSQKKGGGITAAEEEAEEEEEEEDDDDDDDGEEESEELVSE